MFSEGPTVDHVSVMDLQVPQDQHDSRHDRRNAGKRLECKKRERERGCVEATALEKARREHLLGTNVPCTPVQVRGAGHQSKTFRTTRFTGHFRLESRNYS